MKLFIVLILLSTTAWAGPFGKWEDKEVRASTASFYTVSFYDKAQEPPFDIYLFDSADAACYWAGTLKAHPEQFTNVEVAYMEYRKLGVRVECE